MHLSKQFVKVHKNLVAAAADCLKQVFTGNRYADKAIEKLFKQNPRWGSRDRRFVAEAVYEVVRNYRLYAELAGSEKNFWLLIGVWMVLREAEHIPAWPEFRHLDPEHILKQKERLKKDKALYNSWPQWLWDLAEKELGSGMWEREAEALNEQAKVVIRMNRLRTDEESFLKTLAAEEVRVKKLDNVPDAWELEKRQNVFQIKAFKEGHFEVQDAGSQLISLYTAPVPGQFVIDACAGAGGKTLHLASLMRNKGRIISMDVEQWKLEELKKRARRAGAYNVETRLITGNKDIKALASRADKLLLDVPCSGLGVIKRNPDAKWKLSPEVMERTKSLQEQILNDYCIMVKPGGSLIYSTCSILPSENRQQVDKFLLNHGDFTFVRDKNVLPSEGYDGFYMCELMRKES